MVIGVTSLALAFSLSMDSFAAALGCGASYQQRLVPEALRVGLSFGVVQLAMALMGWLLGTTFAAQVQAIDHWIAFGLLALIGGSMVRNALCQGEDCDCIAVRRSGWLALLTMAVATSIDASAVGVGLAVADLDIVVTASLIGLVTFLMGFGGVLLGRAAGTLIGRRAELVGGLGLIAIGTKILVEHTLL